MRNYILIALITVCTIAWSGCTRQAELASPSPGNITRFMLVNADPSAPAVDVYVDKIKSAQNLEYEKSKGYISMLGGGHELSIYPANADITTTDPLITQKLDLQPGKDFTILIVGTGRTAASGKTMKLLSFNDDNTQPPAGKARVRFINAVSDVPGLDLRVVTTKQVLSSDIGPDKADKYKDINSGVYELSVNLEGLATPVADLTNAELKSQGVYTIVAMGFVTEGNSAMGLYRDK